MAIYALANTLTPTKLGNGFLTRQAINYNMHIFFVGLVFAFCTLDLLYGLAACVCRVCDFFLTFVTFVLNDEPKFFM